MSTFNVRVVKVDNVVAHPNADLLDLAKVGGYNVVVGKGNWQPGDLAVYIPEQAILPQSLIEQLGLVGKLAGSNKNRVKAIRLRGELSQGIIFKPDPQWQLGQDVADIIGITKYEPAVPAQFMGIVAPVFGDVFNNRSIHQVPFVSYDIDNVKQHATRNPFVEGQRVVITEKLHGTFIQITFLRDNSWFCSSKGLGAKGLVILDVPQNQDNVYVRTVRSYGLHHKGIIEHAWNRFDQLGYTDVHALTLCGEVFGDVQDLKYGCTSGRVKLRVFDCAAWHQYGYANSSFGTFDFLSHEELNIMCAAFGVVRVPTLYVGKYDQQMIEHLASGNSVFDSKQIKEGVVVRPVFERIASGLPMNRLQLKFISPDYLLRKTKDGSEPTEFN